MIRIISRHRTIVALFGGALAFVVGGFSWVLVTLALRRSGTGSFILHFTNTTGITQVGSLGILELVGVFSIVVLLINFAISIELDRRNRFLGLLLGSVTLALSVLLFISCAAILNVN